MFNFIIRRSGKFLKLIKETTLTFYLKAQLNKSKILQYVPTAELQSAEVRYTSPKIKVINPPFLSKDIGIIIKGIKKVLMGNNH